VISFYRSTTKVVDIGRKSTHPKGRFSADGPAALFRCPVISRRHAKITFTDSGSVQIVDLSSHHGTHILRPGDTVSKMISPNLPNTLAEGDVVTFGKSVGRDETLVRPVTVRVHLIGDASSTPDGPTTPLPAARCIATTRSTSSSGRYGLYARSSSSSSSRSSSPARSENGDSDIEEIPRPAGLYRPRPIGFRPTSLSSMNRSGRLGLLRRLLPAIHRPEVIIDRPLAPPSPISISSKSPSPEIVEVVPEPNVVGAWPGSQDVSRPPSPDFEMLESLPSSDSRDVPETPAPGPSNIHVGFEDAPHDDHIIPQEDAKEDAMPPSPPSTAPVDELDNTHDYESMQAESSDEFPEHQEEEILTSARSDRAEVGSHPDVPADVDAEDDLPYQVPVGPFPWMQFEFPAPQIVPIPSFFSTPPPRPLSELVATPLGYQVTRDPSADVEEPVLDSPPTDLFGVRMEFLKARLADLEKQLREQGSDNPPVATAQAQVQVQQPDDTTMQMQGEASAAVQTLKDMVTAMEELRDKAEADLAREIDIIQAAHAEAAVAVVEAKAHVEALAALEAQAKARVAELDAAAAAAAREIDTRMTTLKRKRDAVDDDGDGGTSQYDDAQAELPADVVAEPDVDAMDVAVQADSPVIFTSDPDLAAPPTKRRKAMRIVGGVVKTTAIAAVGAVAAWSVLAYS
jgi:hypothetical protein